MKVITDIVSELITNETFLTIIAGVGVYALSQFILELVIVPAKQYKALKQKIGYSIALYCRYYNNPYNLIKEDNFRDKGEYEKASDEFRKIGAELAGYLGTIPKIRFKKRKKLELVLSEIIGISNGFYQTKNYNPIRDNQKGEMIIKKQLKI